MNKHIRKSGLAALGAVIGLVSVSGVAQDDGDLERKMREVNIMNNIFEAAVEQQGGNGRFNIRRIGRADSMYLAGQGMVFTFRLLNNRPVRVQGGAFGQEWMQGMEQSLARTRESLERVREIFPEMDFDFDFDFDFDDGDRVFIRNTQGSPQPPQGTQVFFFGGSGPEREAAQEMEEAMRDTQEQVRDMQRQVRQLEREIRNGEAADEAAAEAEIAQIEARVDEEMAKLDEQRQAYETFLADIRAARQEQQQAIADEVTGQLITTLCDYGASLRSLEDDEHVTIILEEVTDSQDQVFVFDYSDVRDCRSADTLRQNAVSYMLPDF